MLRPRSWFTSWVLDHVRDLASKSRQLLYLLSKVADMTKVVRLQNQLINFSKWTLTESLKLSAIHSGDLAHLSLHIPDHPVDVCPQFKLILLLSLWALTDLLCLQTHVRFLQKQLLSADDVLLDEDSELVGEVEGLDGVDEVLVGHCADDQQLLEWVRKKQAQKVLGGTAGFKGAFGLLHDFVSKWVDVLEEDCLGVKVFFLLGSWGTEELRVT